MAAKKKAAKKKAAKKKTVKKKATSRKKAATSKKTARKKAAKATDRSAEVAEESAAEPPAPEVASVEEGGAEGGTTQGLRRAMRAPLDPPAEARSGDDDAAGVASIGLARGRRRTLVRRKGPEDDGGADEGASPARAIPPLPDVEEEFVPFQDDRPRRRRPRRRGRPGVDRALVQKLERVRRGDLDISDLDDLGDDDLAALARHAGVRPREGERRSETIYRLVNEGADAPRGDATELVQVEGLLELHPDSYGFLRRPQRNYTQHPDDVYVAAGMVRRLGLKAGHWISGKAHRRRPNQPQLALHSIDEVNHEDPEKVRDLTDFDKLTVIYPDQRLHLETTADDIEMRIMDLFCPLGRGQRGLIVAPPRTGKTIMLTKLADAIATNSPDVDIVVLLVDERPEEVTNMRRSVRGEVIASTFDKPASNHIRVAELVVEKVKRMVEFGRHVVLLLDSITRMGRAYNNATGGSGRILTGGLDAKALTKPKRFFGSARNVEDGGSLTIVATALVDTGSRMDEVIFEEFKGTGNMELVLSRDMANARVWPAIDVPKSATRNEDLLMHPDELRRVTLLRRGITGQDPQAVMLALRDKMKTCATNAEFLMQLGN